jgi:hypothetical protein
VPEPDQVLTRRELTAALAARQMLLARGRVPAVEAIRRLTPLQGQDSPAPYVALAARLDGFTREELEAAIAAGRVVKSTLMRRTLHLAAAEDYPAFAQLARQSQMRSWRRRYAHLDEERVTAELTAWFSQPRTNDEIRERVRRYDGISGDDDWEPLWFARLLLPLVRLAPAGFWNDPRQPRFVVHDPPRPDPVDAAATVLERYLGAFGPASRRDIAAWAGVAQADLASAVERVQTVRYRDERGAELLDLPGAPLPPASTRLPVRLLARWDQPLLAYADRDRIIPPELLALNLTITGDQTVTVDGRVAASWSLRRERDTVVVAVRPHAEIVRSALPQIRSEARRIARFCHPDAKRQAVEGV